MRAMCLTLPEVTERPSHGAPTWFVRDKISFVTLWADGHHENQFPHLWCAAPPGVQQELTAAEPARFFRPPYVGRRWLGGAAPGQGDTGAAVAVVVPEHAVAQGFGFQPHLRPARPQADPVPEDLHPAQARVNLGTASHD